MSKKNKTDDQIPLSESQNTAVTGRNDVRDDVTEISINGKKVSDKVKNLLYGNNEGRPYRIKEAKIKEDLCQYAYEITSGVGIGDTHNVKGSALIENDLRDALSKLNVHMAFIDDAFKHKGIEVSDIDQEHNNDLTYLYYVTGFKMKGTEEAESVILLGSKSVSLGRMEFESPKISLDNFSSYKWYNELKAAIELVREEVALYKEGKCISVEVEEEKTDLKQNKLPFGSGDAKENTDELEEDFANAAL